MMLRKLVAIGLEFLHLFALIYSNQYISCYILAATILYISIYYVIYHFPTLGRYYPCVLGAGHYCGVPALAGVALVLQTMPLHSCHGARIPGVPLLYDHRWSGAAHGILLRSYLHSRHKTGSFISMKCFGQQLESLQYYIFQLSSTLTEKQTD